MSAIKWTKREFVLWVGVFLIAGLFQIYRGAPLDGTYFLLSIVVMVLLHGRYVRPSWIAQGELYKIYFLAIVLCVAFSRIHTKPSLAGLLLVLPLFPFALNSQGAPRQLSLPIVRSIGIWGALAATVAGYEMLNYIVGDITSRGFHYPTISMLVDPMLHNAWGRVFFVFCWGWIGSRFLFSKRAR